MHEHSHEHLHDHMHTHEDGTTHTHSHVHEHTHEHGHEHAHTHEHLHDHEAVHNHDHDHHHHHHDEAVTPMDELMAMLNYMVGHNASHVRETKELAEQLKYERPEVYAKILTAVEDFEKGNGMLADALQDLKR